MKTAALISALVLSLSVTPAFANGSDTGHENGNGHHDSTEATSGSPTATSTATSTGGTATAVGYGVGYSNSSAGANANNRNSNDNSSAASNQSAVTFNEAKQRNNTPGVGVVYAAPTATCRVAHGGGVSAPGFGISFGSSTLDEGCHLIEVSKQLSNLGLSSAAIMVMCQDPAARKVLANCPSE